LTPERFEKIQALYHAAREASAEQREAMLSQTDPELRQEVESLLAQPAASFLETPAIQNAADLLDEPTLIQVGEGARLGPYRIESKLGEGGMGQVFRAVDTRLGRTVAVKTSRGPFSDRFEREARAISSLNHPNICTLFDVGPDYLVMELVEGESLAAILSKGPLPLETAILFASQIASALAEAHSKGIIHRDLKPSNIMVGKSGVKVLDFGLARMHHDDTLTGSHMILGTPAYMAPEQQTGGSADHRADIYAFGLVLYEMCTGTRPGPQRKRLPNRNIEKIVFRCLEDDPKQRWQSMADVQQALASAHPVRRHSYIPLAIAGVVVIALAVAYWVPRQSPKLTVKDKIVVADFENKTGDPIFEPTLRQGLIVQLEQSPFLALVPDQQLRQVLKLMNRPRDTRLTPEVAREICERTGSTAVLEGSIAPIGSQYVLWLRARNCRTGDVLAEEQAQAIEKEKVLDALSRIAVQTRTRLGESLASIQEHSTPLAEATTGSIEALKAYSAGQVAKYTSGGPAALPHYRQAIALDPQFAMAHADIGFTASGMGQTELGEQEVSIAYNLRDRVSDRERLYITMLYDRQVTGNLQKELHTLETWEQNYPRDAVAPGIIAGWYAYGTGEYEKGIQYSRKAIQLSPDMPFPYASIAFHSLCLDQYEAAEQILQLAAERKLEIPEFLVSRYYLGFLKGDRAQMDREVARARLEHSVDQISHYEALVLARSGKIGQARAFWDRAIALAQQAGNSETVAIYHAAQAVVEAHYLNREEAKKHAQTALRLARNRNVLYAAAFALARAGDVSTARTLASELEKRFPEDTPVQFEYLPILRALSDLDRRAPASAIEQLQRSAPYDYAMPNTMMFAKFGAMYTVYVRGEAYLAGGNAEKAAAEFQKVIKRRGLVLADPIGALAHLQLGRAYTRLGDRAKAKAAYEQFLSLWQQADPDLTILKQAKSEYATL
jgi:serine/threonine protein kinase/tetratricopeptide (TPR) repeat protein